MKRYARCPICGTRAVIEYGNILREHVMVQIAPGGYAPKLPAPLCYGPRPTAEALGEASQPSLELSAVGGRGATGQSSITATE